MNFLQTLYAGGTLGLAFLLASCGGGAETDNAQVQADISPVIPRVGGTVIAVRVADNQAVRVGDTVAVLDDRDFRLRVQQAEQAVAQAEANVVLARQNTQAANQGTATVADNSGAAAASVAAARAGVRTAQVRLRQANQNLNRQAALLAEQSTTQQAYDDVKAEKDAGEAALNQAQAQVRVLERQAAAASKTVGSTRTEAAAAGTAVRLAELAVEQARTNLATARLNASYTVLTAPATGVVSDKSIQLGQVVNPGQTLMRVANAGSLWVVANFKETQLEKMRVGQTAEVKVDSYPDKVFQAKVQSLSPATGARFSMLPPDNATGNFVKVTQRVPVKLVFTEAPDQQNPLRAGMSVTVTVKDKI
ncbi:HlyD family secretion protein [Hymenobacter sp. UYCo722]|uniref:HlyD family secretion protein n=1 Tax=Hymenobacter sp. UYCo722 TaxID=3156335 RepID=UPI00339415EF